MSRRPVLILDADRDDEAGPLLPQLTAWLAAWGLFAWPWLSGQVTIPWDAKAHFLPQIQFLAASFARGEWPFWAPQVFGGQLQIADPQSMIFSPPMLLLALLDPAPSSAAVDAAILLSLLVSGAGVILYARDLRWHPGAQVLTAISYEFGAVMAWRLQHDGQVLAMAYLPFALLLLRRTIVSGGLVSGLFAGVAAGLIAAGRDQVSLLCLYLLTGYVLWLWAGERHAIRHCSGGLGMGVLGGVVTAALPVLMTAILATQSNRPVIDFEGAGAGSLHPALLITALAPHLYGAAGPMETYWGPPSFTWTGTGLFIAQNVGELYIGAIPFLLVLAAAVRGVAWAREVRFFSIALVFVLLYALGWYTPAFRVFYTVLPGVDLYRRPADAVFLVGALGAVVAGYACSRLLSGDWPVPAGWQRVVEAGVLAGSVAFAVGVAIMWGRVALALPPLVWAAAWFAGGGLVLAMAMWLKPIRPVWAVAAIVAFSAADLALNNGPNGASALPLSYVEMLEPGTSNETVAYLKARTAESRAAGRWDRVELIGLGFHWPNASLTHDLHNTLGYNPVRLKWYADAVGAEDGSGGPERKFPPLFPSYDSPLARLLGLRWIASGVSIDKLDPHSAEAVAAGRIRLAAKTPDGFIYEATGALPRALFATAARQASFDKLIAAGPWPDVDPATTVLLENVAEQAVPPRRPGSARIRSYGNTEIVIEADSPDGGWVVLGDVWHPWWRAEVDGVEVPLLRANVIFRAVEVGQGRHEVRFVLRPFRGLSRSLARLAAGE